MVEIEKQAATVYTRAMFYKVRDQILKEGKYIVTCTRRYGDKVTYNLTKYNAKTIRQTVVHDMTMDAYECECCYFPTLGIPCRHIFAVMKNEHVIHLPDSLIVSHWTMKAKENLTNNFVSAESCKNSCSEERARYGLLSSHGADISFLGSQCTSLFNVADSLTSKLYTMLQNKWYNMRNNIKKPTGPSRTNMPVQNPLFTRTKGFSKFRGASKGLKRCTLCNKIGHNKITCTRKKYAATECSETAFTPTTSNDYEVGKIHLGEEKEA